MLELLEMTEKLEKLLSTLKQRGPCIVAYSGGVDSAFLLHVASQVLPDQVMRRAQTAHAHPVGTTMHRGRPRMKHLCVKRVGFRAPQVVPVIDRALVITCLRPARTTAEGVLAMKRRGSPVVRMAESLVRDVA